MSIIKLGCDFLWWYVQRLIGVKEYILVSQDGSVELYKLQNDNYKDYVKIDNKFKSDSLNITLDFDKIFSLVQKKFN